MKRKVLILLTTLMTVSMMLTACEKNINKMDDSELYTYLISMDEDERTKFINKLDDEQKSRAYFVLLLADFSAAADEDDFQNDINLH